MDRAAFLEGVREAVATVPPADLPLAFPRTPASASSELADFETFRAALARNNGMARSVLRTELADAVTEVARELSAGRRTVVAPDVLKLYGEEVEQGLAAAGAEVVRPEPRGWRDAAAGADLGVTSAALAVASTGSILIVPGPDHPRVASLLPPAHLAVLPASLLVAGLEDVMPVVTAAADRSSAPVLITGPSRTSDIEMTTVFGVHGPKVLRVLLVQEP
jgi:L-lactate dehydrogenase complex protein LldG